jgi:hypothetical protein
MTVLILFLVLLQIFLTAIHFRMGVGMMLFILVFFPQEMSLSTTHDISLLKLSILIAFAATIWVSCLGKDKRKGDFRLYYKYPLLFLFFLLPSFLFMGEWGGFGNRILQMFLNFIVYELLPGVIVFRMVRTRDDIRFLCRVLVAAVVLMGCYGLVEFLLDSNLFLNFVRSNRAEDAVIIEYSADAFNSLRYGFTRRIQSTAWHPIAYGGCLSMYLIVILFYYGKVLRRVAAVPSLVVYVLILVNIFLCMSRAPWMATMLSLAALVFLDWRNLSDNFLKKRKMFVFLLCTVMAPVGLLVVYKVYVFLTTNDANGSTMSMRLDQAVALWDLMKSNLLFGFGFNAAVDYMHNNSIQTEVLGFESILFIYAFNYGVFGLAGLLFLYGFTFRSFRRFGRNEYYHYFFPVLISHFLFVALSGDIRTFRIFWVLYSLLYAAYLLERREAMGDLFAVRTRRAVTSAAPAEAGGADAPSPPLREEPFHSNVT